MGGSIERGKEIGENLESKGWKVKYTIYEGGKNKGKMNWLGENIEIALEGGEGNIIFISSRFVWFNS